MVPYADNRLGALIRTHLRSKTNEIVMKRKEFELSLPPVSIPTSFGAFIRKSGFAAGYFEYVRPERRFRIFKCRGSNLDVRMCFTDNFFSHEESLM
jgi:hypothetical protein